MEPHETVLSDVHIYHSISAESSNAKNSTTITRFEFAAVPKKSSKESSEVEYDADGDLVISRGETIESDEVFEIEHCMSTTLDDVGLQVWNGALIMCDFIMSHENIFKDQIVMELGCGVGLTAVCAAFTGTKVIFATDVNEEALKVCSRNVDRNSRKISSTCDVRPKFFDWDTKSFHNVSQGFRWSKDDISIARKATVIMTADVYDSDSVPRLFQAIRFLCKGTVERHVFLSLEKRFNFSLEALDVVCTAYEQFSQCLEGLRRDRWKVNRIDPVKIPLHFPQFPRSSQLELWHLQPKTV